MVLGANLTEDRPVVVAQQIDEELACGGECQADGLGLPVLLQFDEEEVVAQLGLGDESGVELEVFVDQPQLAVAGVRVRLAS